MENNKIEVKVRYNGDLRNWEEIDILALFAEVPHFANNDINQIRWNYEGCEQGHYILIDN
jgi:hypothetical protein